jgi:hypothetical protein
MLKRTIGVATALIVFSTSIAFAQGTSGAGDTHENGRLSQTEFKILTDARVGMVRIALQLTPEQQQYWPAVEDAIRARSEARYRRLSALEEQAGQWREVDPVQLYRRRADALTERAVGLKKLADAWQPLYQSLTPDQRIRLRLVTVRALESVGSALENRRMDMFDEDDPDL